MLTKLTGNEHGAIFRADSIPNDLFNFYILRRRDYKNGTSQWNICCELSSNTSKYMIIEVIKGTKENAIQRLNELLKGGKNDDERTKRQAD